MNQECINQINIILNKKEIDSRIKPLIKLYFLGKIKLNELNIEQLKYHIDTLCFRISNVEFSSNNIIAAYSSKAKVLTVNKKLILEGKSDEVILPVFMKFETALNQDNRKDYANNIEDFIKAGKMAKALAIPISGRLYKLHEMAEYFYGNSEQKVDELIQDTSWLAMCSKYNNVLNNMIITGQDNSTELFTGCTQDMIEEKSMTYTGNSKISTTLETVVQSVPTKISEEFIESKVQSMLDRKPEFDNRIKHLIILFFIRSQKIYNWDMDEFQERLNQIDIIINKIVFEVLDEIEGGNTDNNILTLNSKIVLDKNEKVTKEGIHILFHELGHFTDENYREDIGSKERLQEANSGNSGSFYEWTNTIFDSLASGEKLYKRKNAMQTITPGYDELNPLGSMLACALGIPEIELVRIKDKGKDYEEQLLEKMFPNTEGTNLKRFRSFKKCKRYF